jgi:hypothetical protein
VENRDSLNLTDSDASFGAGSPHHLGGNKQQQSQQQSILNPFLSSVLSSDTTSAGYHPFGSASDSKYGQQFLSKSMGSFVPSSLSPPKSAAPVGAGNGSRASLSAGGSGQHGNTRAKTANPMPLRGLKKEEFLHTLEISKVCTGYPGRVFLRLVN